MKAVLAMVAAGLIVVTMFAVPTSEASPAATVVSQLRYSPNPLYDDDYVVTVSFKTSRVARPGYEWGVVFSISGSEPFGACSSQMLSWNGKFGGNARKHQSTAGTHDRFLTANRYGDRFCKGRGTIFVVEHKVGQEFAIGRPLGPGSELFDFRVLRS